MPGAICTLFEKSHHFGVAALVNSLHKQGFRGDVYAGYRGNLPQWASKAILNASLQWANAFTLELNQSINIHFLPIEINSHLAHYKPDFMLRIMNELSKDADSLTYFDPDIVVNCRWSFYEKWISYGVAVVHEITSNDMPDNHPIRMQWKQVISELGKKQTHAIQSYLNCGFCGVARDNIDFIKSWSEACKIAINKYGMSPVQFAAMDRTQVFWSIDQDAFNIAAMSCDCPISEMGPEGMDFIYGGWAMSHAIGYSKPWNKNYLLSFIKGYPPSSADKKYWLHSNGLLTIYNPVVVKFKKVTMLITSFLSRFYRRT